MGIFKVPLFKSPLAIAIFPSIPFHFGRFVSALIMGSSSLSWDFRVGYPTPPFLGLTGINGPALARLNPWLAGYVPCSLHTYLPSSNTKKYGDGFVRGITSCFKGNERERDVILRGKDLPYLGTMPSQFLEGICFTKAARCIAKPVAYDG